MRRFEELDSTNRWVLDQARAGASAGLVAIADHQTAGRGRLGRTWEAPPAENLLMSVLLRPDLPPERLHLVTAAVALAGVEAAWVVAGVEATLKWPNDVVVGDAKLAGVLAESSLPAVVVGIGLNVGWAPPGAACLAGAPAGGRAPAGLSRDAVADAVLAALAARVGDWDGVARDHRRACSTVGRSVRVELADESFTGTAADVTDEGHLLVDVGACLRTVTAGDVVHLRPT